MSALLLYLRRCRNIFNGRSFILDINRVFFRLKKNKIPSFCYDSHDVFSFRIFLFFFCRPYFFFWVIVFLGYRDWTFLNCSINLNFVLQCKKHSYLSLKIAETSYIRIPLWMILAKASVFFSVIFYPNLWEKRSSCYYFLRNLI